MALGWAELCARSPAFFPLQDQEGRSLVLVAPPTRALKPRLPELASSLSDDHPEAVPGAGSSRLKPFPRSEAGQSAAAARPGRGRTDGWVAPAAPLPMLAEEGSDGGGRRCWRMGR